MPHKFRSNRRAARWATIGFSSDRPTFYTTFVIDVLVDAARSRKRPGEGPRVGGAVLVKRVAAYPAAPVFTDVVHRPRARSRRGVPYYTTRGRTSATTSDEPWWRRAGVGRSGNKSDWWPYEAGKSRLVRSRDRGPATGRLKRLRCTRRCYRCRRPLERGKATSQTTRTLAKRSPEVKRPPFTRE